MGCLNYLYGFFKNLKDLFKNYQARDSGYDAHQHVRYENESDLKLRYPPVVASSMHIFLPKEHLKTLTNDIADSFACGIFVLVNLICSKQPKNTSSFDDDEYDMMNDEDDDEDDTYYYIDENDLENDEDDDEDDEYYFIDEYDTESDEYDENMLSAYIDEYDTDNEDSGTDILSEDETEYSPAITIDNSWSFIEHDDLSVGFKDTSLPPKRQQKAIDYFKRFVPSQS
ncbi:hypothetical protein HPULCUR_007741 [Helicostylum pulchrum]|uniref:Uncharacterized protein n=1 Tax=Helicostylum pulchrum TaxID=562976 RepID=A0ABP9Y603_9FUNG